MAEMPGASHARAAIAVEQQRQGGAPWDAHDGVLSDPEALEMLRSAYGERHVYSVNQLEQYLSCPFAFFMQRVLCVEHPEEVEQWFDPKERGLLLHAALCAFHREFENVPAADIPEAAALPFLRAAAESAFKGNYEPGDAGINRLELERMLVLMRRYLTVERAKQEPWAPAKFELSFGGSRVEGEEAEGTPYIYATADGAIRLRGRIDRIDRGPRGLRIIDYKTGGIPGAGDIFYGQKLQLSLYARALEDFLFPGERCAEAWYLCVGRPPKDSREALAAKPKLPQGEREEHTRVAVARAVAGMRGGQFPPAPGGPCFGCGSTRACRYDEGRAARKAGEETSQYTLGDGA